MPRWKKKRLDSACILYSDKRKSLYAILWKSQHNKSPIVKTRRLRIRKISSLKTENAYTQKLNLSKTLRCTFFVNFVLVFFHWFEWNFLSFVVVVLGGGGNLRYLTLTLTSLSSRLRSSILVLNPTSASMLTSACVCWALANSCWEIWLKQIILVFLNSGTDFLAVGYLLTRFWPCSYSREPLLSNFSVFKCIRMQILKRDKVKFTLGHHVVQKTHKGLKRVTRVQCSWTFILLSTIFGNPRCGLKKTICLQQHWTCIALFCTFLCRHRKTTTWKCLFSRFVEGQKTRQRLSFSFSELRCNHMRVTRFCAVWKGKEKPWGQKYCRSTHWAIIRAF